MATGHAVVQTLWFSVYQVVARLVALHVHGVPYNGCDEGFDCMMSLACCCRVILHKADSLPKKLELINYPVSHNRSQFVACCTSAQLLETDCWFTIRYHSSVSSSVRQACLLQCMILTCGHELYELPSCEHMQGTRSQCISRHVTGVKLPCIFCINRHTLHTSSFE